MNSFYVVIIVNKSIKRPQNVATTSVRKANMNQANSHFWAHIWFKLRAGVYLYRPQLAFKVYSKLSILIQCSKWYDRCYQYVKHLTVFNNWARLCFSTRYRTKKIFLLMFDLFVIYRSIILFLDSQETLVHSTFILLLQYYESIGTVH